MKRALRQRLTNALGFDPGAQGVIATIRFHVKARTRGIQLDSEPRDGKPPVMHFTAGIQRTRKLWKEARALNLPSLEQLMARKATEALRRGLDEFKKKEAA